MWTNDKILSDSEVSNDSEECDGSSHDEEINESLLLEDEDRLRNDANNLVEKSYDELIARGNDEIYQQFDQLQSYQCTVCDKRFSELMLLQRHYVKHIVSKPYKCGQCEKSFFDEDNLSKHSFLHTVGTFYPCAICEKSYFTKTRYDAHFRRHSFKDLVCNACFEEFSEKGLLEKHERTHTDLNKNTLSYPCFICDLQFVFKQDLEAHMDTHEKVKDHVCEFCNTIFFFRYCMRTHIHSHNDRESCNYCAERFPNLNMLSSHEKTHINMKANFEGKLDYQCGLCTSSFSFKYVLEDHYNTCHDDWTNLSCKLCGKKFFFAYLLREHKKTHKKDTRPFVCDTCPKTFRIQSDLIRHRSTHDANSQLACPTCNKLFADKWHLKNHSIVHSTERPYVCFMCDISFRRRANLERHYLVHSTESIMVYQNLLLVMSVVKYSSFDLITVDIISCIQVRRITNVITVKKVTYRKRTFGSINKIVTQMCVSVCLIISVAIVAKVI